MKFITTKRLTALAALLGAAWLACLTVAQCSPSAAPQGFVSGGGNNLGGAGGLSRVTTNSAGLLAGSGTVSNPLTATLSTTGIMSGTGSSGSPLTATEVGDISGVTAGSGMQGGGASGAVTLATNLTGGACTAGQVVTDIGAFGATTCSNVIPNDYAGTHLEWVDEFMFNGSLVQGATTSIYQVIVSNGQVNSITGTTTRPGIAEFSTAGNAAGRANLATNVQGTDFGSGNWTFEWTGGFATLSATAEEYGALIGFADTPSLLNQVDGCYFLYDRGNVATSGPNSGNADKWSCWCASNSVRTTYLMDGTTVSDESFTTVNAPVAALTLPNTNIYNLKVIMTGTTRAEFYVNGTKSCDISTHIPSGSARLTGAMMLLLKSNGTTARTMDMDRARLAVDLTSARTTPTQ